MNALNTWAGLMVIVLMVAAYLVPLIVALSRSAPNWQQVAVVDVLLGWTAIGWIVALVMALKPKPARVIP